MQLKVCIVKVRIFENQICACLIFMLLHTVTFFSGTQLLNCLCSFGFTCVCVCDTSESFFFCKTFLVSRFWRILLVNKLNGENWSFLIWIAVYFNQQIGAAHLVLWLENDSLPRFDQTKGKKEAFMEWMVAEKGAQ